MSDQNGFPMPPADEPMDDAARARIRALVVAGFDDKPARGRRAVPLAAAAAVAVVAAMVGYVAVDADGDSDGSAPPQVAASTVASETPTTEPSPVESASDGPTEEPSETPTDDPSAPEPQATQGDGSVCTPELRYVLRGAEPVLTFGEGSAHGTFYVKGDTWVDCEVTPETTTIQGKRPLVAPYDDSDVEPWQVSTNIVDFSRKHMTQVFAAGGPLPEGVLGISYAFPDGSTQVAETKTDDEGRTWWRMEYAAQEGVLADPDQNQTQLDQILVTVSTASSADTFALEWGLDTCAQLNHGC